MNTVHPEFAAYGSFAHLPLGRKAAKEDRRTLRLADYLDEAVVLPQVPEVFQLTPQTIRGWPMYGNNQYGDCTCAAAGHMVEVWTAASGAEHDPIDDEVLAMYWATGTPPNQPCPPGGPTDDGRVEIEVLNYWRQTGLGVHKIGAYVAVDPSNHDHLRIALYLFGGLYTGIALPRTAQGQSEWSVVGDGKTGDAQPGSWGGHAVPYLPYWDGQVIPLVTWGGVLQATVGFHDAYCDEAYAVVSPEFLNQQGQTPQGLDVDALNADLAAIAASQ